MWHTQIKLAIGDYTALSQDALHVHAAILIYIAVLLALRSPASLLPWLVVCTLETLNEGLDLYEQYSVGTHSSWSQAIEGGRENVLRDFANTMVWPSVMLIFGRWWNGRASRREPASRDP